MPARRTGTKRRKKSSRQNRHTAALRTVAIFASRLNRNKTIGERLADVLTVIFGSMMFLILNFLFFIVWIVINLGVLSDVVVFDPYPFGMLTMVVSLEAIFLSIFVLISQNRAAKIADLREETDFQVTLQAEREATKMVEMLDEIRHALKIPHKDDRELKSMEHAINVEQLEEEIAAEMKKL